MNQEQLPANAFLHPSGVNKKSIEDFISEALKRIINISTSEIHASITDDKPDSVEVIPESSIGDDRLLDQLESILLRSVNTAHPGWIPHMDPPPATASVISDLAAASVNNNMLSTEMSPVFSRLERQLVKKICQLFSLSANSSGMLCSGGTLANLQALTVARNVQLASMNRGTQPLPQKPVLFASEVAHTSIQKAAMVLGLGTDAVLPIAVDAHSKMKPHALKQLIQQSRKEGMVPFCVIATAGTTTTGNIDLLEEIGAIAHEEKLWYHIDAAYGGALIFSDSHKDKLAGISTANSVTFNPQKWLYVAKTCAMVLFNDFPQMVENFRINAPYMEEDKGAINLGEISIQGTRHADILKLWASLQHIGRKGFQQLIDESYRITHLLYQRLRAYDCISLASDPEMNILCFRGQPDWIASSSYDSWNKGLQQYLLSKHEVTFSLPTYRNSTWLRTVILNPFVDEQLINKIDQGIKDYINQTRQTA